MSAFLKAVDAADDLITGGDPGSHLNAAKVVRAVLLAIRDPDEGMLEAGGNQLWAYPATEGEDQIAAENTFTAMIDAILNESP